MKFVDALEKSPLAESQKDPRVRQVISAWSACMKKAGYEYPADPYAPGNDPRFNTPDHRYTPAPGEIETAVADTRCAIQTDLVGTWFSIETEYQNTVVRKNQARLKQCRHSRDAVLQKAAAVVKNSST